MHLQRRTGPRGRGSTNPKIDQLARLIRRQDEGLSGSRWTFVGIFGGLAVLLIAVAGFTYFRKRRAPKTPRTAKDNQGVMGRLAGYWRTGSGEYHQTSGAEEGRGSHALNNTSAQGNGSNQQGNQNTTTVDRHTSVRSVITLPAYRQAASQEEQVLGREGERGGVDVIVDMPTAEDDEALREQEMDTLYQIRLARRRELAEREERARLRREARARNDSAALSALSPRSGANNNREEIQGLRNTVEQVRDNRQRSVSSVSYADLGVARHDGSRLRANSNESERVGLLSDAASMAASGRQGASSPQPSHLHSRGAGSIISVDSDLPSPDMNRLGGSGRNTPRISIGGRDRAGSSPELVEADLGDEAMQPPEYEEVPLDTDGRASPFDRSTTPLYEPPPNYPGRHRSGSPQDEQDMGSSVTQDGNDNAPRMSRGVDGTPRLPSLRIGRLPSIVIEPSSALPANGDQLQR